MRDYLTHFAGNVLHSRCYVGHFAFHYTLGYVIHVAGNVFYFSRGYTGHFAVSVLHYTPGCVIHFTGKLFHCTLGHPTLGQPLHFSRD